MINLSREMDEHHNEKKKITQSTKSKSRISIVWWRFQNLTTAELVIMVLSDSQGDNNMVGRLFLAFLQS